MNRILVTGGNGQVAHELIRLLRERNYVYVAPTREQLDVTNLNAVVDAISDFKPDAVINAAAYTKVDQAQQEEAMAYAVNYEGAKNVAIACEKVGSPLLHISTDYIFDGLQATPYLESSPIIPLNIYGASKRKGELAVLEHHKNNMILRVSGVFGVHGHNFVKTMLRLAKENETLRIVADQTICPTPAKNIAETILLMLQNPHQGIYHYCGEEPTSWHNFTQLIIEKARLAQYSMQVKTIEPITTAEYPTPALRPVYSVLNCQRIADTFGIKQPDWKLGLTDVISQLSTS